MFFFAPRSVATIGYTYNGFQLFYQDGRRFDVMADRMIDLMDSDAPRVMCGKYLVAARIVGDRFSRSLADAALVYGFNVIDGGGPSLADWVEGGPLADDAKGPLTYMDFRSPYIRTRTVCGLLQRAANRKLSWGDGREAIGSALAESAALVRELRGKLGMAGAKALYAIQAPGDRYVVFPRINEVDTVSRMEIAAPYFDRDYAAYVAQRLDACGIVPGAGVARLEPSERNGREELEKWPFGWLGSTAGMSFVYSLKNQYDPVATWENLVWGI